jgi:hypothetical protein
MRSILACLAQGFIPGFKRRTVRGIQPAAGFVTRAPGFILGCWGKRGNKRKYNVMRERPQWIQVFIRDACATPEQ